MEEKARAFIVLYERLKPIAKAVAAVLAAFVGGLAVGLDDDALTLAEVLQAVLLALAAGGVVYRVPNKQPPGKDHGA